MKALDKQFEYWKVMDKWLKEKVKKYQKQLKSSDKRNRKYVKLPNGQNTIDCFK